MANDSRYNVAPLYDYFKTISVMVIYPKLLDKIDLERECKRFAQLAAAIRLVTGAKK